MTEICFLTMQMGFSKGLTLWLADGHLLSVTPRGLPVRVVSRAPFLRRMLVAVHSGPLTHENDLAPCFNLNASLNTPSPNTLRDTDD